MALHDPHVFEHLDGLAESDASEPVKTFGRYLLFKRLQRNGLGEIYRAGVMGENEIERLVFLRLFNAAGIDGNAFHTACQSRADVSSILRGGHFGEVVELGREQGVAFIAHEYVPGRTVAELIEQARETSQPVPLEHALQIMERVAISLQNAYEMRIDEKRLLHGFLIPEFVHVSIEGEIQLHGFELSAGLLQLPATGAARSHLTGYIAPEVNAGQPPTPADDVYSLGAMFAELLTGEPLPALNPAESSRWVEAAMLADEGTALPEAVRNLLRDSLLPRDQRIKKAERWHQSLMSIINASDCSPTTFNLAFFVHTLFGDQLERDVLAVDEERRAQVPPEVSESVGMESDTPTRAAEPESTADPVVEPEPAHETEPAPEAELTSVLEPESDEEDSFLTTPVELQAPPPKVTPATARSQSAPSEGPNKLIAFGVAALVIVALAIAYFVFGRSDAPARTIEVTAAPSVESTPADVVAIDDLGTVAPPLAPEEIEEQVRSLVARRASALEENLKAEYDERLVELRKQLEVARTAAETPDEQPAQTPAEAQSTVAAAPTRPEPVLPAPVAETEAEPGPQNTTPAARPLTQTARQQAPQTSEPTPRRITEPSATDVADTGTEPPLAQPARQRATEATSNERRQEPPVETVVAGSIVVQGPGVTAPRMTKQPNAVYPPAAARLKRQATVKLRVLVDENGAPAEVEQVGKDVGLGFDQAAIRAARNSRWTPPTKNGVPVKMWVELSIDFRP